MFGLNHCLVSSSWGWSLGLVRWGWGVFLSVEDDQPLVNQAAVPRLQAVRDALFHFLAATQEAAAVSGQFLPGPPPVFLFLATAGEKLLHVFTETNLDTERDRDGPDEDVVMNVSSIDYSE